MSAGVAAVALSHDSVRIPSLSPLPLSFSSFFICWLASERTVPYSARLYGAPYNGSHRYCTCTRPIVFLLLVKEELRPSHSPPPFFLHPSRSIAVQNII